MEDATTAPTSPRQAIGIDVSKDTLEVCAYGPAEDACSTTTVPNTDEGFDRLRRWIDRQLP